MITKSNITIFIISYYRSSRLLRCLNSLQRDINVIVWDNNTTGDELKKLKDIDTQFPEVRFIYSDENVGWSKACNQGLILSDTDWVLYCADDMIFDEDWFDVLNQILEEKPQLEQIHLNAWNAFAFHKQTIVRMGWWDERYRFWPTMDDDDWYLRTVEVLGYSPYGTWAQHIPFSSQYIEMIKPFVDAKESLFNRPDNFTYYCNSNHSKYKVIGESTITGQEDDAGSRNTSEGSLDTGNNITGVEFHHMKWKQVAPDQLYNPDSGALLGKDGRVWVRVIEEVDFYPKERAQYAKHYFNIDLQYED